MKNIFIFVLCITCMTGLFSQERETKLSNGNIYFSGIAFSNVTSFASDSIKNDQLLGWYSSAIRERDWGSIYSKFGIMYNLSAQDTNAVIGIPLPIGENVVDMDSNTLYFPTKRGYVFRPQIAKNTELLLIPNIGLGFIWTGIDYKTIDVTDSKNHTLYDGYLLGLDFSLGFDISMLHNFSNVYLRYGAELNFPMFQLSASRMKKQESTDGGIYYASPLRASSNDFIGINDVFKLEVSPYIAIGIKLRSGRFDWFDEPETERIAMH